MTVATRLFDGRYSLDEQIGVGGFCEVWRATDTVLMRSVAVKVLHASYACEPEVRARFKAEARHAGALSHENIARVYDYGEPADGQSYLVMELITGPSLATMLASGPLAAARTMDIVAQVAAGLHAAHSAGLIHRDIKPANLVFTSEGTVRITDFGIAHLAGSVPLTATGMVLGTAGYLAPERIAGAQAVPASDLYALGIVAYECLTGAQPFSGPPLAVATAHRDSPLPPLPGSVPAEVAALVMMLTAKDPASRPASADEVACQARRLRDRLVSGAIDAPPVPAGTPTVITAAPESQARNRVRNRTSTGRPGRPRTLAAATVASLSALICLILLTTTGFTPASHPAARPSARPLQEAPSMTKPSSMARPVAAQHASHQRSTAPNASTGTTAAVKRTPARHHAPHPGPPRPSHRHGHGDGPHHGPGNGPPYGPWDGLGTAPGDS